MHYFAIIKLINRQTIIIIIIIIRRRKQIISFQISESKNLIKYKFVIIKNIKNLKRRRRRK
jgi:hypothetical protein